jgi:multidrug resistance efflux pump
MTMKFRRLLSFILGSALVLAVATAGLVHTHRRAHVVPAAQSVVLSDVTSVGAGFAGYIKEIHVRPQQQVAVGDELLRLQSPTLEQARQTVGFSREGVGYRIEGEDLIVFVATADGTVGPMAQGVGSFVPANTEITTIQLTDSTHVVSRMRMTAGDFARLSQGATVDVELPSGREVATTIDEISFDGDGSGEVTVSSSSAELRSETGLINNSPVTALVQLDDDEGAGSWLAGRVGALFVPEGHR